MLSKTLNDGLTRYHIGEKLRALRLKKKMGLVELSAHTGLSAALLSKLERARLFPTLPTLLRIALVFGVGLEYFFVEDKRRSVVAIVRQGERVRFPERPNARDVAYHFECLDFNANERKSSAFLVEFEPIAPEKMRPHQHGGIEFIYVLKGKLCLRVGTENFELDSGDSAYFDSSVGHCYRSASGKPCSAIVIVVA
ncbi:MAG TPA: XRE family transcriptional regulator [Terriglobales bacterium]|nr:XRE family transcriptional regulator [Terriglobales bacterium]